MDSVAVVLNRFSGPSVVHFHFWLPSGGHPVARRKSVCRRATGLFCASQGFGTPISQPSGLWFLFGPDFL